MIMVNQFEWKSANTHMAGWQTDRQTDIKTRTKTK